MTGEVIVCCGRTEEELEAARIAGRWLSLLLRLDPGLPPGARNRGREALLPELNGLSKSGRWDEMPGLTDDAMLAARAQAGSPKKWPQTSQVGSRARSIGWASTPRT